MNVQAYELDRLRSANVKLTLALEIAVITIERLAKNAEALPTLTIAKKALNDNKL